MASPPVVAGSKRRSPSCTTSSNSTASARIISGSIGSLITALVVTPLEVVKVHLQNVRPVAAAPAVPQNVALCPKGCGTFVLNNGLLDCVLPKCSVPYFDQHGNLKIPGFPPISQKAPRPPPSVGTFALVRTIFVKEGFRGIYAGLVPTLVMGIPSTVFYYGVYDELVAVAKNRPLVPDTAIPLLAGSSARLVTTLLIAPLELIRTRQASMVGAGQEVTGMMAELQSIVRQDGATALYRGLSPTLWRDVPFSGIYWLCLEQFRGVFTTLLLADGQDKTSTQQAGVTFLSGALAGMVAAACTTPFDVVKTRQQAVTETTDSVARSEIVAAATSCCCNHDGHLVYPASAGQVPSRPTASVFAYMRAIYETEGVHGLWRGNQARMIKVAPSCAIMITCYEFGKRVLEPAN